MQRTWVVFVVVVVGVIATEECNSKGSNEKYPKKFTLYSSRPTPDQPANSVKEKRSSNLKPSELKLLHDQHRTEALCKFCKKSELRMKSPLCKKCLEEILPSNTPYLLKSTVDNLFDKARSSNNNHEREMENSFKNDELNSLKTNSSVRESILKLIISPFVNKNVESKPLATKMTGQTGRQMKPWKLEDNDTDNHILGNFPSKEPTTDLLKEQNEISPTISEITRSKRLKDIRHLSHNDYLHILKEALRSEENLHSVEIEKRNSNDAKNKKKSNAFKKKLLDDMLSKHILEMDSESDEDILDIVGASPSDKIITKRTTKELTTEQNPTTEKKIIMGLTRDNKLGNVYHSLFNYKKHPRDKLQYINKEWITTRVPPTKPMPDMNILQKIAPDNLKLQRPNSVTDINKFQEETLHSMTENILQPVPKDVTKVLKSTTENFITNIETVNTVSPQPTNETKTEEIVAQKPLFKGIRNQHYLNRHLYLKNPRLKSIYENGKHKYVYKNLTTQKWDILNNTISTTEIISTKIQSEESEANESSDENNLLEVPGPTKIKIISTRSTKDLATNNRKILDTSYKAKNHEIFPTRLSLLHKLKSPLTSDKSKHDIFSRNLNMTPNINQNKFKNVALSLKNNKIKETNQNKELTNNGENVFNDIKTLSNPISHNEVLGQKNDMTNVLLSENKINLPLILKQNDDGTIQLILDKSKICDCPNCTQSDTEKFVYKRKTEDDLTNHPMNVFNILENHRDQLSTQVYNYYHSQNIKEDLKEKFYEYLINQQLLKVFNTLNIPVDSSAELHSYIDDLEDKEKNKLKQYLLNTISQEYSATEGDNINEELFNKKQNEFVQSLLSKQQIEMTTESNRISLQIKSEDDPLSNNLKYDDNSIIKSLIQKEIQKGIENICPICSRQNCVCKNNDRLYFPIDNYSNEGRIIDKRHYVHVPQKDNSFNDHDDLTQKKYKIVNNFLNWARGIVVHNNTKL